MPLTLLDIVALAWFAAAWASYAVLLEFVPRQRQGLNARMDHYREIWMRRMLDREMRIML